ncbi:MAG: hypothetical protein AAFV53_14845 [Myxococcota bacterium]
MDKVREECGVFGICRDPGAARLTSLGLHALQHRGQEGGGIACFDGEKIALRRGMGLVNEIFGEDLLKSLTGTSAIGHVQPFVVRYQDGQVAIAHNGNLVNADSIRAALEARTFIEPDQKIRDFGVKLKLSPVHEVLKDRRVIVVDDSIVRMLRRAGAREVHLRITSPPMRESCYYGVDTPDSEQLVANRMTVEEIADHLGVDSLGYRSRRCAVQKGRSRGCSARRALPGTTWSILKSDAQYSRRCGCSMREIR